MVPRTHRVFAAVANAQRLRVLLAILRNEDVKLRGVGASQAQALAQLLKMKQPAVSQACRDLETAGLLHRPGNTREAFRVVSPRATRALIRAAALIESAAFDTTEALELAQDLLREDMARGAEEEQASSRPRAEEPPRS